MSNKEGNVVLIKKIQLSLVLNDKVKVVLLVCVSATDELNVGTTTTFKKAHLTIYFNDPLESRSVEVEVHENNEAKYEKQEHLDPG